METQNGYSILLLNQDQDEQALLKFILERERDDKVLSGELDISQLEIIAKNNTVNLIILKVVGKIGFDVLGFYQQLQANFVLRPIPVLFWRVSNPKALIPEAKKLGVAGYVNYVFQPHHLLEARDTILAGGTYFPE